ncbi:ATP-binding protein [Frigidibacter sp. MR17.14]|uniref:ATP-binding protein n=1 Tax=Frigidibacter sp. MR17.14 TaxID=3126509 RepID=UPI003012A7F9
MRDLATGKFITNGEVVLVLSPLGVGKTHLAVAITQEVIVADYTVLFFPSTTLASALANAHAVGNRKICHEWLDLFLDHRSALA